MSDTQTPAARAALAADPWLGCMPLDPVYLDDPYPALRRMREIAPVNQTPLGFWRLTRYADVWRLLHEVPAGVRTTAGLLPFISETLDGQREFMLEQDPPNHTRLRRLVSRAFTPRAVQRIRADVQRIVDACLERVADRGTMDVIADLALPVPSTVICEMLGVPLADRETFTVWTAEATHGLAGEIAPPEVIERARAAGEHLAEYFTALIAERRARPGDDLLSVLIRAEEEGDRLSGSELISQSIGLLIAGFETTIGLIGNGVRQLASHPDELAKLRADPTLLETAVEECLRFDGPIPLTVRVLHADAEFSGQVVPKDAFVWAMLAAADRDPSVFDDPERFDVTRQPNEHLAFGGGAHFCLGSHLARLEAQCAIGSLVARFRSLALVDAQVEWGPSLFRVPARLALSVAR
jgi:hypothetical protein